MSSFDVVLLFSPQNCSLEVLERNLTDDRRALAEKLIAGIRETVSRAASRYDLVIGSRGTGKTHLLSYVEGTLRETKNSSLHIVRLSEEELGITSHVDFLVACLRAENVAIEEMYEELRSDTGYEFAEDRLSDIWGDASTLLIVENLASMLREMDEIEQRRLRGFLQRNAHISVLAASPTLFEGSAKADHPLYGFFLIHPLDQLTRLKARDFLIQLAESKGDTDFVESLRSEKAQARVNAVYDLTGGNHRLLGMLSECLTADELKTLVEPFVRMVDRELTPYYQQRLFALPAQQAKILRAIARNESPLTVKEIARLSLASEQTTSSQLRALKEAGLVRSEQHGRESHYELQEPLMRVVLEIKEGREKVLPSIVALLRDWYEAEELKDLAQKNDGFSRDYYQAALSQKGITAAATREVHGSDPAIEGLNYFLAEVNQLMDSESYEAAIAVIDDIVSHLPETDEPETGAKLAEALLHKGIAFGKSGRHEEALVNFGEVAARFAEYEMPEIQTQVARALGNKGVALGWLGRNEDALEASEDFLTRFKENDALGIQDVVAWTLYNKGCALGDLGRHDDAVEVYEEVLVRFSEDEAPIVQESVAWALGNKGFSLERLGRHDDAVEAYDDLLARFSEDEAPNILESVARALSNKGFVLRDLGRNDEAFETFEDLAARFGENEVPVIQEQVAWALFGKGTALARLGRFEEEKSSYDEFMKRFGKSEHEKLLGPVARTIARRLVIGAGSEPELNKMAAILENDDGLAVDIFKRLFEDLLDRPDDLRQLAGLKKLQEELVIGMTQWAQSQLPLSKEEAEELAEAERNLYEAFLAIEGAQKVLDLFSAARAYSLGDKKALLRLPLESRRLVERAYGIGEDSR